MSWFNQLKVRQKLIFLVFMFSAVILVIGSIGYQNLQQSNTYLDDIYSQKMKQMKLEYENRIFIRRIRSDLFELMITTNSSENAALLKEIVDTRNTYDENIAQLSNMPLSPELSVKLDELKAVVAVYRPLNEQAIALAKDNKNAEAYALYKAKVEKPATQTTNILRDMTKLSEAEANSMKILADQNLQSMSRLFIGITFAAILIGCLLGFVIIQQITERLKHSVSFLGKIALGDFSHTISEQHLQDRSEFGSLSNAIEHMSQNVRSLIKQLLSTSEQVAAASQELAASADQSSKASAQVADSIVKVSEGAQRQLDIAVATNRIVEEMSLGVHKVAKNAMAVSESATKTSTAALSGQDAIEQTFQQMKAIEKSTENTAAMIDSLDEKSNQIDKMVNLISTIAEQTNLLALNAAIEAARAGSAGRGFAVVADEVRKLAEQSASASKDITSQISDIKSKTHTAVTFMKESQREVNHGSELVHIAENNFSEILEMIQGISTEIHDISSAAQHLTSGANDVLHGSINAKNEIQKTSEETETISAATEEQSASVEEIASASSHLAKLAEELQMAIQKFKI